VDTPKDRCAQVVDSPVDTKIFCAGFVL